MAERSVADLNFKHDVSTNFNADSRRADAT